jgi:LPXTG-motif cell wall-anchored protein
VVVESNTGVEGSDMYWGHGGSAMVINPTSAAKFNPATTPQWFTYPNASNPGALGMQVYASVPEPGTLLLGGLASLLGGGALWRKRRNTRVTGIKPSVQLGKRIDEI